MSLFTAHAVSHSGVG